MAGRQSVGVTQQAFIDPPLANGLAIQPDAQFLQLIHVIHPHHLHLEFPQLKLFS